MSWFSWFSKIIGSAEPLSPPLMRKRYNDLFIEDERIELAFLLRRDVILLTNLRYIEIDVQGASGSRIEYFSLPYSKITAFSVESAGFFGLDAELKIWGLGVGPTNKWAKAAGCAVHRSFAKGVDVYLVQRVIAYHVCSAQAREAQERAPVQLPPASEGEPEA